VTARSIALLVALAAAGCLTTPEVREAPPGQRIWQSDFRRLAWLNDFHSRPQGTFGLENLSVVSEPAHSGVPITHFLRVRYPAGAASPNAARMSGAPIGGGQFYGTAEGGSVDHLFLRYYVRFPTGFDFVKGGKLPGLYGGTEVSGGRIPDGTNGLSTRFMWRTGGQGEVYAYMPVRPGEIVSDEAKRYGISLGRGSWMFEPGRWQCIEQELVLNTPGKADGQVRVWLDGRKVYETDALLFRSVPTLQIEGIFFSTFFGGGDVSWAPSRDLFADFSAFVTSAARVGCLTSGPAS
jgi:hypothetical protein